MPDNPVFSTYGEGYSSYLYLGPLEYEIFSPLIAGFYSEQFVQEADRRHRLMYGEGWAEAYDLKPEPEGLISWMRRSWGKPREWRRALGPLDAWQDGDDWQRLRAEEKHKYALEHPELIRDIAEKLIREIRTADYQDPLSLDGLHYRALTGWDVWQRLVRQRFSENPICVAEFGEVFKNDRGLPTIPYKLTLEDGTILEGDLPFEYLPAFEVWEGQQGLDWHLGVWGASYPARTNGGVVREGGAVPATVALSRAILAAGVPYE